MAVTRPSEFRYFFGRRAKLLYECLGWHLRNATDLRFMNYGFALDPGAPGPDLQREDEAERFCAQLYHVVATQIDLSGKRVLDIGSGRGGGSAYVHRYLRTGQMIGCDLAERAVEFCRRVYDGIDGLLFQHGDAMDMPFGAGEFDAVLSVESAHCYPDRQAFFREAHRVLRPGGSLLYADFTPARVAPGTALVETRKGLAAAGFAEVRIADITPNIVRGLENDAGRRTVEIDRRFPPGTRRAVRLWAGTPGSWIFRDFQEGRREYLMCHATRPVG